VIGMRERVHDLGGRLSILRPDKGMALTVSFHRAKRPAFAPEIDGL
jgi:signal transduction histidine kinase